MESAAQTGRQSPRRIKIRLKVRDASRSVLRNKESTTKVRKATTSPRLIKGAVTHQELRHASWIRDSHGNSHPILKVRDERTNEQGRRQGQRKPNSRKHQKKTGGSLHPSTACVTTTTVFLGSQLQKDSGTRPGCLGRGFHARLCVHAQQRMVHGVTNEAGKTPHKWFLTCHVSVAIEQYSFAMQPPMALRDFCRDMACF